MAHNLIIKDLTPSALRDAGAAMAPWGQVSNYQVHHSALCMMALTAL